MKDNRIPVEQADKGIQKILKTALKLYTLLL